MTPTFDHIKKIACLGEVMIELIPEDNHQALINVAGDTYNTAVYLRRLLKDPGITVSYLTALGTDTFSKTIEQHLDQNNLDRTYIEKRRDRFPGIYAIETNEAGERSFSYWRSDSAARTMFEDSITLTFEALMDFDLIFLSGITLAILPPAIRSRLMETLKDFRAKGGLVAYDSNHRPRLWDHKETAQFANMIMWENTDLALPSIDDELLLFEEETESQVLERLASAGIAFGTIKRGSEGPLNLANISEEVTYPIVTNVIDTTAAGDSFNAGVLAALIQGSNLSTALMAGHSLSSQVIQVKGAIMPEAKKD